MRWINSKNIQASENVTQFLPLPGGEGRGEGEGDSIIHTSQKRLGLRGFSNSDPIRKFIWRNSLFAIVIAALLTGCATVKHTSNSPVIYHNTKYGLTFSLLPDWRGFTVLTNEWVGYQSDNAGEIIRTERGPEIVLRHPQWTARDPHQDIPIRVFTRAQWPDVRFEKVWIDAGGSTDEISHNRHYVFGIHGRFNWGELTGWEQSQKIVATNCMIAGPPLFPE